MKAIIALTCLGLAACASAAPVRDASAQVRTSFVLESLSWLEGSWSNQAQFDAAPDALKRAPAPGHPYDWLDLQYAEFFIVDAPQLGDHAVYLEWRAGAPDGPISRQRMWVFHDDPDGGLGGMDFYTLRDPDRYAGRGEEAGAFADLTLQDLTGYPDGCTLTGFPPAYVGAIYEVSPRTCTITARSGREMGIQATIVIRPDSVTYSEAGVLADGSYAFLVPGGARLAYQFTRVE